jgi:hypothetical protein
MSTGEQRMGEHRYDMNADPNLVSAAMEMLTALPAEGQAAYMRSMFEAVYTYQALGDPGVLTQFARDVAGSVHAYSLPGFREALAAAPPRPTLPVRSVDEVFAKLA